MFIWELSSLVLFIIRQQCSRQQWQAEWWSTTAGGVLPSHRGTLCSWSSVSLGECENSERGSVQCQLQACSVPGEPSKTISSPEKAGQMEQPETVRGYIHCCLAGFTSTLRAGRLGLNQELPAALAQWQRQPSRINTIHYSPPPRLQSQPEHDNELVEDTLLEPAPSTPESTRQNIVM